MVLDSDKISALPDTPQAWVSWRESPQNIPYRRLLLAGLLDEKWRFMGNELPDIPLFSLWAENDNPLAQTYLGICYHDGIHVDRDLTQAMKWFHCAAEQGYFGAQSALANCYAHDEEVRDRAKQSVGTRRRQSKGIIPLNVLLETSIVLEMIVLNKISSRPSIGIN